MTKHIYLVVYHSILLYIHILARDIRLGLIVIVVGHEIFYRVVGKKLSELAAKLSRQSFIVRQHQRGTVHAGNNVRHSKGLTRARNAKKRLHSLALLDTLYQRVYRLGLIARRLIFALQNKPVHSFPSDIVLHLIIIPHLFLRVNR